MTPLDDVVDAEPDSLFDRFRDLLNGCGVEEHRVLPQQFFQASSRSKPDLRLRLRVLEEGLHDWEKYAFAEDREGLLIFEDTRDWLVDTSDWPMSFANLCDVFGLNVESARETLFHWYYNEKYKAHKAP